MLDKFSTCLFNPIHYYPSGLGGAAQHYLLCSNYPKGNFTFAHATLTLYKQAVPVVAAYKDIWSQGPKIFSEYHGYTDRYVIQPAVFINNKQVIRRVQIESKLYS